uniref:Prolyl 4-hydroxylase alpha subunit domain-containing protein n=1 Tax=Megaselia scalaris TaxID=36166 RepID=T1H3X7_MEGSC
MKAYQKRTPPPAEWSKWEKYLTEEIGNEFVNATTEFKKRNLFPEYPQDLNDAVSGIRRLQDTYQLDVPSFVEGKIGGVQYDAKLSSSDCADIGLILVLTGNSHLSDIWFKLAIQKFENHPENEILGHTIERSYQFAILSKSVQNDLEAAVSLADTLLKINPSIQEFVFNFKHSLVYLNDIEHGGATVFPELDIGVNPRKGSAVFWYNLKENGDGDTRTIHAACPVLYGSKWVFNKWIRELEQDIARPCPIKK